MSREQLLRELHGLGLGEICYPANAGCAGSALGFSGTPSACGGPVTHAAWRNYPYPTRHRSRVLLCELHARLEPQAEPATEFDHREWQRRLVVTRHWSRVVELNRETVRPSSAPRS